MKHLGLAALLVVGIGLLVSQASAAAPRLTLPEESFDFGIVPQNSKVSHVFWLKSTGDDTLKIVTVSPG
ncbi:MAG TPA: hypothetical protein VMS71_01770 [Candidatus Acidoferrum sp.]|nr:hypothetical protein [Candidatus Acidoferrum sp.]